MKSKRRLKEHPGFWADLPASLRRDILAVLVAGVSCLGFVALFAHGSPGLERLLRHVLRGVLGRVAPLLPIAGTGLCLWVLFRPRIPGATGRLAGAALLVAVAAGAAHLDVPPDRAFLDAWQGAGGGLVGATLDWILRRALGTLGAEVVLGTAAVAALVLLVQFSLTAAVGWPFRQLAHGARSAGGAVYEFVTEPVPQEATAAASAPAAARRPRRRSPAEEPSPAAAPNPPEVDAAQLPALAEAAHPAGTGDPEPPAATGEPWTDLSGHQPTGAEEAASAADAATLASLIDPSLRHQLPPLDLLRRTGRKCAPRGRDGAARAAQLEEALRSFGVTVKVADITQGPTITRFEVQPGPGVKVARISGLADDLALALCATDVRIVAPIPGKGAVGIEVPNTDVSPVYLRDVMESEEFRTASSPLTVCLGQDIAGKPVVASLERLLHVLVAGATGSGKSITINAMLISLLYRSRHDQVRLVLIDPKMVELAVYNGIPHLLAPVVTDPRKAAATLRAVVKEMVNRYGLFTQAGVRNISGYNALAAERHEPGLPFVVVVIDELADLMLVARADVEDSIQRLTQMARAAGIHLVVATQRPSVDVITGVIKANIPTRIGLAVSSQVDSRTILDVAGAEKLVGRGDMLFRPMGAQKLVRAQGAFVADSEVEAVLKFLRETGRPEYHAEIAEAEAQDGPDGDAAGEDDNLFVDALQVVVESGQASVSNLQRRLRVGFTRAGRLIDMMEQRGFVGPHQGSKSREVLLTLDQFRRLYGERPEPS